MMKARKKLFPLDEAWIRPADFEIFSWIIIVIPGNTNNKIFNLYFISLITVIIIILHVSKIYYVYDCRICVLAVLADMFRCIPQPIQRFLL
jgi:hypothetical protein